MSQTLPSVSHPSPCDPHEVQPTKMLDFNHHPAELVDRALQTMQQAGIEFMIEWRAVLYHRMKVPIFVKNFSYVVPDNQLELASDALSNLGLPLMPSCEFRTNVNGELHTKGRFHRITPGTESWNIQQIVLYPLSFSTLSLSELTEETPHHLFPSVRCQKILIPRPSAVYASLIRMISRCSINNSTRTNLMSDLSELVGYHLYELSGGYVDPNDDELWEKLEIDKRLEDAYSVVLQWGCEGEWRDGEEWIGDALAAIARGTGDIRYLPQWPRSSSGSYNEASSGGCNATS